MFSLAISFRREMMAAFSSRGGASWLKSTPSTRKRMRNSFSNGSMWMSLARFSMASAIMALTSRMTGASLAMSRRCSRSALACSSSPSATPACVSASP